MVNFVSFAADKGTRKNGDKEKAKWSGFKCFEN